MGNITLYEVLSGGAVTQFIDNAIVERSDDWAYQSVDQIIQQSLSVIQDPDEGASVQGVSSVDTARVSSESPSPDDPVADTRVWRSFILDTIQRTVTELGQAYGVDTASVDHIQRVLADTRSLDQVQILAEWSPDMSDRVEATIVRATQRALLDHRLAALGIVPYTAPPSASAVLYPSGLVPLPVSAVSVPMESVDTAVLQLAREAAQSVSGPLALADWIALAQSISSGLSVLDAPEYCQSIAVMLGVNSAGESVQGIVFPDADGVQRMITTVNLVDLDAPIESVHASGIRPAILRYSDTAMVVDGPIPGLGVRMLDRAPIVPEAIAVDAGRLGQVIATEQTQGRNPMTFIDPDAAVVVDLVNDWQASGYVQAGMTESEIMTAVHRYVADKIQYQSDVGDQWQTVEQTLARGAGDCEDMAILVASLAARALHAVGMDDLAETVRLEAGLMANGSVGHMVARVGEQWVVDATQAVAIQDRAAVAMDSVYVLGMNGVQQTGRLDQVARLKRVGTAQVLETPQVLRKTAKQYLQWYIEMSGLFGLNDQANEFNLRQDNPTIGRGYVEDLFENNWDPDEVNRYDDLTQRLGSAYWQPDIIYTALDNINNNNDYNSADVLNSIIPKLRYDGEDDQNHVTWQDTIFLGQHNNGSMYGQNGVLSTAYEGRLITEMGNKYTPITGTKRYSHHTPKKNPGHISTDILVYRISQRVLTDTELEYIKQILLQQPSQAEIDRRYAIAASIRDQGLASAVFGGYSGVFGSRTDIVFNIGVASISNFTDINKDIQRLSPSSSLLSQNQKNAINYIFGNADFSSTTLALEDYQLNYVNNAISKFLPLNLPPTESANFNKILKFSLSHSGPITPGNVRDTDREDQKIQKATNNIENAVRRAKNIYNKLYSTQLSEDNITNLKDYLVGGLVYRVDYTDNPYEILAFLQKLNSVDNPKNYAKLSDHYVTNSDLNQDDNLNRLTKYEAIKNALKKNVYDNNKNNLDSLARAVQEVGNGGSYVNILNRYFQYTGDQIYLYHLPEPGSPASKAQIKLINIQALRSQQELEIARNLWFLIYRNEPGVQDYYNRDVQNYYESYSRFPINQDPIKFFFEKLRDNNGTFDFSVAETETQIAQALYETNTPPPLFSFSSYFNDGINWEDTISGINSTDISVRLTASRNLYNLLKQDGNNDALSIKILTYILLKTDADTNGFLPSDQSLESYFQEAAFYVVDAVLERTTNYDDRIGDILGHVKSSINNYVFPNLQDGKNFAEFMDDYKTAKRASFQVDLNYQINRYNLDNWFNNVNFPNSLGDLATSFTFQDYVGAAGFYGGDSYWFYKNPSSSTTSINNPQRIQTNQQAWESFKTHVSHYDPLQNGDLSDYLRGFRWSGGLEFVGMHNDVTGGSESALDSEFNAQLSGSNNGVVRADHIIQRVDSDYFQYTEIYRINQYCLTEAEIDYFKNLIQTYDNIFETEVNSSDISNYLNSVVSDSSVVSGDEAQFASSGTAFLSDDVIDSLDFYDRNRETQIDSSLIERFTNLSLQLFTGPGTDGSYTLTDEGKIFGAALTAAEGGNPSFDFKKITNKTAGAWRQVDVEHDLDRIFFNKHFFIINDTIIQKKEITANSLIGVSPAVKSFFTENLTTENVFGTDQKAHFIDAYNATKGDPLINDDVTNEQIQIFKNHLKTRSLVPSKVISILQPTAAQLQASLATSWNQLNAQSLITVQSDGRFSNAILIADLAGQLQNLDSGQITASSFSMIGDESQGIFDFLSDDQQYLVENSGNSGNYYVNAEFTEIEWAEAGELSASLSDDQKSAIHRILILAKTKKAYWDSVYTLVGLYNEASTSYDIARSDISIGGSYTTAITAIKNCQERINTLQREIYNDMKRVVEYMTSQDQFFRTGPISDGNYWSFADVTEFRRFQLQFISNANYISDSDKEKFKADMLGVINQEALERESKGLMWDESTYDTYFSDLSTVTLEDFNSIVQELRESDPVNQIDEIFNRSAPGVPDDFSYVPDSGTAVGTEVGTLGALGDETQSNYDYSNTLEDYDVYYTHSNGKEYRAKTAIVDLQGNVKLYFDIGQTFYIHVLTTGTKHCVTDENGGTRETILQPTDVKKYKKTIEGNGNKASVYDIASRCLKTQDISVVQWVSKINLVLNTMNDLKPIGSSDQSDPSALSEFQLIKNAISSLSSPIFSISDDDDSITLNTIIDDQDRRLDYNDVVDSAVRGKLQEGNLFNEKRAKFINEIFKEYWQLFNRRLMPSAKARLVALRDATNTFTQDTASYKNQQAVKENYNKFLDELHDAYFHVPDDPDGIDGGLVYFLPRGNDPMSLMLKRANYIIPEYNPLFSSFTINPNASLLMNTIELQRVQRELFSLATSVQINLQSLMNKEAELMAWGQVIEAYLYIHRITQGGDSADNPIAFNEDDLTSQTNIHIYSQGASWLSLVNNKKQLQWLQKTDENGKPLTDGEGKPQIYTWDEFKAKLRNNDLNWTLSLPQDFVMNNDNPVLAAMANKGVSSSLSRALHDDAVKLTNISGQTFKFLGDYRHDASKITLDFLTRYVNLKKQIESDIQSAPSSLAQMISRKGSFHRKMGSNLISEGKFGMSGVKSMIDEALKMKHVLNFLYYLISQYSNRIHLFLSVFYNENSESATPASAEFDPSELSEMVSSVFSNRIAAVQQKVAQQETVLQFELAKKNLLDTIVENPMKDYHLGAFKAYNDAIQEVSEIMFELQLLSTAEQAVNQAKSIVALSRSDASSVLAAESRLNQKYNSMVTYERSKQMEDYTVAMDDLINLLSAPPGVSINIDIGFTRMHRGRFAHYMSERGHGFNVAWMDNHANNYPELKAAIKRLLYEDELDTMLRTGSVSINGYSLMADEAGGPSDDYLDNIPEGIYDFTITKMESKSLIDNPDIFRNYYFFIEVDCKLLLSNFLDGDGDGDGDGDDDSESKLEQLNRIGEQLAQLSEEVNDLFYTIDESVTGEDISQISQRQSDYAELQAKDKLTDPPLDKNGNKPENWHTKIGAIETAIRGFDFGRDDVKAYYVSKFDALKVAINKLGSPGTVNEGSSRNVPHVTFGSPEQGIDHLNSMMGDNGQSATGSGYTARVDIHRRPMFDVDEAKLLGIRDDITKLYEVTETLSRLLQKINTKYRRIMDAMYGRSSSSNSNNLLSMVSDNKNFVDTVLSSAEEAIGSLKSYANQAISSSDNYYYEWLAENYDQGELAAGAGMAVAGMALDRFAAGLGPGVGTAMLATTAAAELVVDISLATAKRDGLLRYLNHRRTPKKRSMTIEDIYKLLPSIGDPELEKSIAAQAHNALLKDESIIGNGYSALNPQYINNIRRKLEIAQKMRLLRIELDMRRSELMENLLKSLYNVRPDGYLDNLRSMMQYRSGFGLTIFEGIQRDMQDELNWRNTEHERAKQIEEVEAQYTIDIAFAFAGFALKFVPGVGSALKNQERLSKLATDLAQKVGEALSKISSGIMSVAKSVGSVAQSLGASKAGKLSKTSRRRLSTRARNRKLGMRAAAKQVGAAIKKVSDLFKKVKNKGSDLFKKAKNKFSKGLADYQEAKIKMLSEANEYIELIILFGLARNVILRLLRQNILPIMKGRGQLTSSDVNQSIDLSIDQEALQEDSKEKEDNVNKMKTSVENASSDSARAILMAVLVDSIFEEYQQSLLEILAANFDANPDENDKAYYTAYQDGFDTRYFKVDHNKIANLGVRASTKQAGLQVGQLAANTNVRIMDAVMRTLTGAPARNKTAVLNDFARISQTSIRVSLDQVKQYAQDRVDLKNRQETAIREARDAAARLVVATIALGVSMVVSPVMVAAIAPVAVALVDVVTTQQRSAAARSDFSNKSSQFVLNNPVNLPTSSVKSTVSNNPTIQGITVTTNLPNSQVNTLISKDTSVKVVVLNPASNNQISATSTKQTLAGGKVVVTTKIVDQKTNMVTVVVTEINSATSASQTAQNSQPQSIQADQVTVRTSQSEPDVVINAEDIAVDVDNQMVFNMEAQTMLERKLELINIQQKFVASAIEKKNTIIEAILAQLFGAAFEKNSVLQTIVANQYQINQQLMGATMASARDWIIRENAIRNMEADASAALISFGLTMVIGGFAGKKAAAAQGRKKSAYKGLSQLTNSAVFDQNFQQVLQRRGEKAFTENIPMAFGIDNFASVDTEFGDDGKFKLKTDAFAEKTGLKAMYDNDQARRNALRAKLGSGNINYLEGRELVNLENQNSKYLKAREQMKQQSYEVITQNSGGMSNLIKSKYGVEGIRDLRKSFIERAKQHRELLNQLNTVVFDEGLLKKSFSTIHPGDVQADVQGLKKQLIDMGLIDSANVLKVQRTDKGWGSFWGMSNDLRQRKSVFMGTKNGKDAVYYTDGNDTGVLESLNNNQVQMMKDLLATTHQTTYSIFRGLGSALFYYASLGIIPSGLMETLYDEFAVSTLRSKIRKMIKKMQEDGKLNVPLDELSISQLNQLKLEAGVHWFEILSRMGRAGDDGAKALLLKMRNAHKLPYSRGRLANCLRGATRDDKSQKQADYAKLGFGLFDLHLSLEVFPSEIKACLRFFDNSKIFDEDGVSKIGEEIPGYNTMDETNKQSKVSKVLQEKGLKEKLTDLGTSDDRANSIVDMVVTFLVHEVRECEPSASASPAQPLPDPATPPGLPTG